MQKIFMEVVKALSDPWVLFGFSAQFVFFMRFVVQWLASEKAQRTVIPMAFWYLSIIGSLMILVYAIKRHDIVFTTASILNTALFVRNVFLARKGRAQEAD